MIIILTLLIGCEKERDLKFKISSNYSEGIAYLQKERIIEHIKSDVDIYFFKNNFNQFYGLPEVLINEHLKDKQITEWAFEDKSKELTDNWIEFYKYDSEGRLIEYKYSGCNICSQFSWGYKLLYDSRNRVIEQQTFSLKPIFKIKNDSVKTEYELDKINKRVLLTYDTDGGVLKLEKYGINGIEELIELLK